MLEARPTGDGPSDGVGRPASETGVRRLGRAARELGIPTLMLGYSVVHAIQVEGQGRFTAALSVRVLITAIVLLYVVIAVGRVVTAWRDDWPERRHAAPESTDGAGSDSPRTQTNDDVGFSWPTAGLAVLTVAYIVTLPLLGYLLSTALFLMLATALLGSRSLRALLLMPVVTTLLTNFIFLDLLNIRLPSGSLLG